MLIIFAINVQHLFSRAHNEGLFLWTNVQHALSLLKTLIEKKKELRYRTKEHQLGNQLALFQSCHVSITRCLNIGFQAVSIAFLQ
jgi:mRNA-degrading endonuclease YafQ of YafQ-DinJ toxin-antitoxin module